MCVLPSSGPMQTSSLEGVLLYALYAVPIAISNKFANLCNIKKVINFIVRNLIRV